MNVRQKNILSSISSLLSENKDAEVYLRADRYAKHKHVKEVMAACAEGGVVNVIFATFPLNDLLRKR